MNPNYPRVAARACHRCEYCHAPEAIFNSPFEVEHIIPAAAGGNDDEQNLALACRACNLLKSDAMSSLDPLSGDVVALFHPRRDVWEDHFRVETDGTSIEGTSATGRATAARLQMNRSISVSARIQWRRLGLFP